MSSLLLESARVVDRTGDTRIAGPTFAVEVKGSWLSVFLFLHWVLLPH
jgi:hypothetical protein